MRFSSSSEIIIYRSFSKLSRMDHSYCFWADWFISQKKKLLKWSLTAETASYKIDFRPITWCVFQKGQRICTHEVKVSYFIHADLELSLYIINHSKSIENGLGVMGLLVQWCTFVCVNWFERTLVGTLKTIFHKVYIFYLSAKRYTWFMKRKDLSD